VLWRLVVRAQTSRRQLLAQLIALARNFSIRETAFSSASCAPRIIIEEKIIFPFSRWRENSHRVNVSIFCLTWFLTFIAYLHAVLILKMRAG
jgi:hypothetical protein